MGACLLEYDMKFGIRKYSINKRISSRFSAKRFIRHSLGFKMPRGFGWINNPHKYSYNKLYNKTSKSFGSFIKSILRLFK